MALHVTTEVGRPGRRERERRHFGELRSAEDSSSRGRLYIPHGQGDQPDWKPHGKHLKPRYTEFGPDWKSRLRYIPPPRDPDEKAIIQFPGIRYYPYNTMRTNQEWSFYPEGFHTGRRCRFEVANVGKDIHMASSESSNEISHRTLYGRNRKINSVWEARGGIPWASPGDKSYQVVEYSPNFHHYGSTRPVISFGGTIPSKPDTFVPLQELPPLGDSYFVKERRRQHHEDVDLVQDLEEHRPASPLLPPPLPDDRRPIPTSYY
ncbi:spermatogenesis-associated serine-rich protein 1-like isoform X2 [Ptychodera flava]|uniref:spermatogenesis-associated serine-rich protein 1-like isoform X2 n=1 Tax=Ptychodera flava TaxID=63121 RepID=UPI003969FF09